MKIDVNLQWKSIYHLYPEINAAKLFDQPKTLHGEKFQRLSAVL